MGIKIVTVAHIFGLLEGCLPYIYEGWAPIWHFNYHEYEHVISCRRSPERENSQLQVCLSR